MTYNESDFFPVEVTCNLKGISIVGVFPSNIIIQPTTKSTTSLQEAFGKLPTSLEEIVGTPLFHPDSGFQFLKELQSNRSISGASDASFKTDRATHAWILSAGKISGIEDPLMNVSGSGPVHGQHHSLSSTRGEIQGITTLTIMASLLSKYSECRYKLSAICDNKGAISKCAGKKFKSLHSNYQANMDLFLTQEMASKSVDMTIDWVKGHMDKKHGTRYHSYRTKDYPVTKFSMYGVTGWPMRNGTKSQMPCLTL
jgi:hypothetical protein